MNLSDFVLACSKRKEGGNDYYYYIRLTAFFQDNLGKPAP